MTTTPEQRAPAEVRTATTAVGADLAAPSAPPVTADDALRAAKPPVGTGASPLVAQLLALGFVALGVVAVQHLLVSLGVIGGTSWTSSALALGDGIDGSSATVLVAGVAAVVLGVVLLPVVVRRRPRKGLALRANTGVHIRPRDLARVIESALDGADGVTHTSVKVGRRTVRVRAASVAAEDRADETRAAVTARADAVVSTLAHTPRLWVTIRHEEV